MREKVVLLVEDNEDNRFIYSTILERRGYLVLEAETGEAGVRLAREHRPDLILMDISLPVLDGLEATRLLQEAPETRGIPVVAVTAHAMVEDRERAELAGCSGYLVKPIEPTRVLAEVERLIGPATGPDAEPRKAAGP